MPSLTTAPTRIIPPPPPGWTWDALMQEALSEARQAEECGEVPVGAVVVSGSGELLARSGNRTESLPDPSAHAEVLALSQASRAVKNCRLEGAVLVVTLEPCLMCAGAITHARLAGVVYGAPDAKAGAVASCLEAFDLPFLNHHVWHMGGVREEECAALLTGFFQKRRLPEGYR